RFTVPDNGGIARPTYASKSAPVLFVHSIAFGDTGPRNSASSFAGIGLPASARGDKNNARTRTMDELRMVDKCHNTHLFPTDKISAFCSDTAVIASLSQTTTA